MIRREITAAFVKEAGGLFGQGLPSADVAARLQITPYVAALLAETAGLPPVVSEPRRTDRRVPNAAVNPGVALAPGQVSDAGART